VRGADEAVQLHWEAVLVSTVEVGGLRGFWGPGGEWMRIESEGAEKRADGLNYDAYYGK
jgi:hypothetical protein